MHLRNKQKKIIMKVYALILHSETKSSVGMFVQKRKKKISSRNEPMRGGPSCCRHGVTVPFLSDALLVPSSLSELPKTTASCCCWQASRQRKKTQPRRRREAEEKTTARQAKLPREGAVGRQPRKQLPSRGSEEQGTIRIDRSIGRRCRGGGRRHGSRPGTSTTTCSRWC